MLGLLTNNQILNEQHILGMNNKLLSDQQTFSLITLPSIYIFPDFSISLFPWP